MRFSLRTLLILTIFAPPLLAWLRYVPVDSLKEFVQWGAMIVLGGLGLMIAALPWIASRPDRTNT